jgi:cytochrome c
LFKLRNAAWLAVALALLSHPAASADSQRQSIVRGHAFVLEHCSLCHAVERTGVSSYAPAPPFRTLHERYDVEGLAEAFAEGVVVPHAGPRQMPQFMLSPAEIDDLIAYLKSLEPRKRR